MYPDKSEDSEYSTTLLLLGSGMKLDFKHVAVRLFSLLAWLWFLPCQAQPLEFPIQGSRSPRYWLDVGFFRQNSQTTRVELYYSIALNELQFHKTDTVLTASFIMTVIVTDRQGRMVVNDTHRKGARSAEQPDAADDSKGLIDQFAFALPAGSYRLETRLTDEQSSAATVISGDFTVPAFTEPFSISEPQLSLAIQSNAAISAFVKGNISVMPNAARRYRYHDATLPFYFEMYADSTKLKSTSGTALANYAITDQVGDTLLYIARQKIKRAGPVYARVANFDVRGLEQGEHRLQITLTDSASGFAAFSQKRFWISAPPSVPHALPTTPADIKRYRDQIKYIAKVDELRLFDALDAAGKANFVINFWRLRDTTPETPENEYMQNVFARIDYCMKNFKGKENGLNSDMGRVFVIYGQPDDIETHTWETGSKPYTIWKYFTSHAQHSFVFVDRNHDSIFTLVHSTVEEEIKNFNWQAQELQ